MEDGRCKLGLPGRLKSVVAALAGYQRERAGVALVFAIASAAARSCRWALSSETEALTLTAPERTSRIGHVQQGCWWLGEPLAGHSLTRGQHSLDPRSTSGAVLKDRPD